MKQTWQLFQDAIKKYSFLLLFAFSLLLMDTSFRAFHQEAGNTFFLEPVPMLFTFFWILIFSAIVFVIPGTAKKIVMSATIGFFAAFCFANATLYHVSGSFLAFSDLAFAEDAASFLSFQYFTFSWKIYLFLILSLALGIFSVILVPKNQNKERRLENPFAFYGSAGAVFLVSVIGLIFLHAFNYTTGSGRVFQWTDTYDPGETAAIYTEFSDPNEVLLFCGNYQYLFRSLTDSLVDQLTSGQTRKQLDAYYQSLPQTKPANEMTGVLKGQNLIAIMLESIDTWMVTEDFMPNLYALQQKSVNFTENYTPLYLNGGTFNTEFAFNIGYFLPSTGTSARTYATNIYPNSLPNLFRNAGYTANSYHGLDGRFYNRQVVHLKWGYESFNDHEDLGLVGDHNRDTTLMQAYEQITKHEKPFFSYIITYSGHGPYTEESDHISQPHLERSKKAAAASGFFSENEGTWSQFERAIAHAMETDEMIGQLLQKMQEDGTIHNTALVLFGDHYSKYLTDDDFVMSLKGATDMNTICKTPFLLYSETLPAFTVEKVVSSVDMLPTIANLFGLDYDARYLIGNDAFGEDGGFVCFKDFSWIDSDTNWNTDEDLEETAEIRARNQEVHELLSASWETVKTNYFQYLQQKKNP